MATSQDIINSSLRLIGVLASGETPASSESNDALTVLNQMLDNWSVESLLVYANTEETFSLSSSQQSYTWGTGGNFNSARPQKIENAVLRTVNGGTTYDLPLDILNKDQWASITVKSVASSIPTKLYPLYSYPLATVYLWPIPSAASSLVVWSWKPLSSLALLTTSISLPPGYAKALRYNLAVELAPEYGRQLDPVIIAEAVESKGAIKRMNNKPNYLGMDEALLSQKPTFNWLTGE